MTYLPDEILYMVCTQLWYQRDFDTLFNCACSGKQLALLAIKHLYRMQGVSTNGNSNDDTDRGSDEFADEDEDEEILAPERIAPERIIIKCAGLWRTIILSSLGKTLYPYSQHIRKLDLRDLKNLLKHPNFGVRTSNEFFQDELAQFQVDVLSDFQNILNASNTVEITNKIGEVLTKQTPLLEKLCVNVVGGTLSRWIPRLPRLALLEIWYDAATKDNGTLIRRHCHSFKKLYCRDWSTTNRAISCQSLAALLKELRPQSLESFKSFNYHPLETEYLEALSGHAESLTEFDCRMYQVGTPTHTFSLLQGCTNLVSFRLLRADSDYTNLKMLGQNFLDEIVRWLTKCKNLRVLDLIGFYSPSWIAPILLENSIHLSSFEYEGSDMRDIESFHQALSNQTSLQSFWLKGNINVDESNPDALVESLSRLVNLTSLRHEVVPSDLVDRHIVQLAGSLPKLEVWSTEGQLITDDIWGEVGSLRSLRKLDFRASTSFTTDGILAFLEKLGPGNKGLVLSAITGDTESRVDQKLIQETITEKLDGKFIFYE